MTPLFFNTYSLVTRVKLSPKTQKVQLSTSRLVFSDTHVSENLHKVAHVDATEASTPVNHADKPKGWRFEYMRRRSSNYVASLVSILKKPLYDYIKTNNQPHFMFILDLFLLTFVLSFFIVGFQATLLGNSVYLSDVHDYK